MSPRTQPAHAPGVVKLRLLGELEDIEALAAVLGASPAVEVIDRSGPRANRYDAGVRVYLTVRTNQEAQQ